MSQPLVTSYFNTRKSSQTSKNIESSEQSTLNEDSTGNSPKIVLQDIPANLQESVRVTKAMCNIRFDSPKASPDKVNRSRARVTRSCTLSSTDESQTDIKDSLLKMGADSLEIKKMPFEKKGTLSRRKKLQTPKKSSAPAKEDVIQKVENEPPAAGSLTPPSSKISTMERLAKYENLSFNDVKNKIKKSPRLEEIKAIMQQIDKLEILVGPQKGHKSPTKALSTLTKDRDLSKASTQRQLLFEPKEPTSSPVKCSPARAYQRYLSITESKKSRLPLPYSYEFLAEVFRCMDMVSAMLFNRGDVITFTKLKPAVQEMLRCNFTQEHLAQIKTIYPNAYSYHQKKHRNFGSTFKQERYELMLIPVVEANKGSRMLDADNILKTASKNSMGPTVLLERQKKFYNALLERVKDEHEKFLLSLDNPQLMNIPGEKIMCWHFKFDVNSCKKIEQAELPLPPQVEKLSAKDVLDKAKSLFNCGTRMETLSTLVEANLTLKSKSPSSTQDSTTQTTEDGVPKVNITIVDTPLVTSSTQTNHLNSLLKGIPKALLEKIRAKEAANALEAMTRTPNADKEAASYSSSLPEFAKLLRNIFVAEKKSVLPMEAVIQKLDNSYRTKLTLQEMEEHIKQLCKLSPT